MSVESIVGSANPDTIVWGAKAIGLVINRNERQTFYLLESGHISCAKKLGNNWAASTRALEQLFAQDTA